MLVNSQNVLNYATDQQNFTAMEPDPLINLLSSLQCRVPSVHFSDIQKPIQVGIPRQKACSRKPTLVLFGLLNIE